ncbi:hypothetical protein LCGC14_2950140, partial [marine sediment metagenome]
MFSSLDSTAANTVYQTGKLASGCIWSYYYNAVIGINVQTYLYAQSLVYFNLSPNAGKTIDSATLRLVVDYTGAGYYPLNWQLRAMYTAWSSTTVTWNVVVESSQYELG